LADLVHGLGLVEGIDLRSRGSGLFRERGLGDIGESVSSPEEGSVPLQEARTSASERVKTSSVIFFMIRILLKTQAEGTISHA